MHLRRYWTIHEKEGHLVYHEEVLVNTMIPLTQQPYSSVSLLRDREITDNPWPLYYSHRNSYDANSNLPSLIVFSIVIPKQKFRFWFILNLVIWIASYFPKLNGIQESIGRSRKGAARQ